MSSMLETVQNMSVGSEVYLNMFQGGGSLVKRINEDLYYLYEIPLYGGEEQFYSYYRYRGLPTMVDVILNVFV